MIIDSHVHIFPDKIADKAVASVRDFYDLAMSYDGRLDTILTEGAKAGVDKFLILSVATAADQVTGINNFLAKCVHEHSDKLIGFCAMHPDFEEPETEIKRAAELGLKGIKLHPDFQRFEIDSEKAMRIYKAAAGKMPILFHTGDFRTEWSSPSRMAKIAEMFPDLDIIASHFGGWSEWDEAARVYKTKNVYVDSSSSLYSMSPEEARKMIDVFGADHVFFGTDFPMWDIPTELERFSKLPLTDEEREMIFHKNIENLLAKYEK